MRPLKLTLAAGAFGLGTCLLAQQLWAQTPATPPTPPTSPPAALAPPTANARSPDQEYKECLGLWEKATHMTRAEWAATCRRVQSRLNEVTGQPVSSGRRRAR